MVEYFYSTFNSAYYINSIEKSIKDLEMKGINNIEISSGHSFEKNFFKILKLYRRKGVKILLHNYAPPGPPEILLNLSDQNDKNRNLSIKLIKERMLLTKKLGMDYYSFHGGFCARDYQIGENFTNKQLILQKYARNLFIKSLKNIAVFAEKIKINIGFENNVVRKDHKGLLVTYSPGEIKKIFKEIPSKNLYLHIDTGHLKVTAKTYNFNKINFLNQFKDKIMAVHLNENNGDNDQNLPIAKNSWFLPLLKKLSSLKYVIFETKSPLTKKIISNNHKLLNESLD